MFTCTMVDILRSGWRGVCMFVHTFNKIGTDFTSFFQVINDKMQQELIPLDFFQIGLLKLARK